MNWLCSFSRVHFILIICRLSHSVCVRMGIFFYSATELEKEKACEQSLAYVCMCCCQNCPDSFFFFFFYQQTVNLLAPKVFVDYGHTYTAKEHAQAINLICHVVYLALNITSNELKRVFTRTIVFQHISKMLQDKNGFLRCGCIQDISKTKQYSRLISFYLRPTVLLEMIYIVRK